MLAAPQTAVHCKEYGAAFSNTRGSTMIYKFKSQAAAEVIMLAANGDQMLTFVGKEPLPQGVITVAQIPDAIAALEAAVATHAAAEFRQADHPHGELAATGDGVRLGARAAPFIELLRTNLQARNDVVWGV